MGEGLFYTYLLIYEGVSKINLEWLHFNTPSSFFFVLMQGSV